MSRLYALVFLCSQLSHGAVLISPSVPFQPKSAVTLPDHMEKMLSTSESRARLHPLVARLVQEFSCPSPGHVPSDPEQPRQGCLRELKRQREYSAVRTKSANQAKELLLKQLKLDNTALNPVLRTGSQLEAPLQSSILKRRALSRASKEPNSA